MSVGDAEASETEAAPHARGAYPRLLSGLRKSLHGNATAFGYSVTITGGFGAIQLELGPPRFGDLILFACGAVLAFGGLEALLSRGFRRALEKGADQVITLATALSFISIALAIASARGLAAVLDGGAAWFAGAFGASLVFVLVESLEFMIAQWLQDRRGVP